VLPACARRRPPDRAHGETVTSGHGPVRPRVGAVRRQERGAPGQFGAAALHVVEADLLGGRHGAAENSTPAALAASRIRRSSGRDAVEVVPDHPANVFRDRDLARPGLPSTSQRRARSERRASRGRQPR
jgi:hypothetical protein